MAQYFSQTLPEPDYFCTTLFIKKVDDFPPKKDKPILKPQLFLFQTLRKPSGDMRARLEEAEERRKAQSEAKLKAVRETTGLERHNRMRSASATRREAHYSATVEKRQKQLQGRYSVLSWDS